MPKQYVTVAHSDLDRMGFRRYLYNCNKIVVEPTSTLFSQMAIIECPDSYSATNQADRFSSGLMGARVHNSLDAAETYLEENKE